MKTGKAKSRDGGILETEGAKQAGDIPRKLLAALIACKDLHVPAVATTGYRNKMLFGLDTCQTSELGSPAVNAICESVFEWVQHRTKLPRAFWLDVSCKITLTNRAMLKLAVDEFQQGASSDAENMGASWPAEQPLFLSFLLDRHPNVDCIAVHASKRAGIKPTKDDAYTIVYGTPYVLEQTPNGVPFALSPDTFCEVNHEMEDHVFHTISSWCELASEQIQDAEGTTPNLLTMGRNTNSLTFGLMKTSKLSPASNGHHADPQSSAESCGSSARRRPPFHSAFALTHCPLAQKDILINTELTPGVIPPENCLVSRRKPDIGSYVMALPQDRPTVVAVTAGRAGLHANTIRAYKDNAAIRAVIYDACNNPTLARDMLTFLSGPSAWRIARFRSFDFFHGTDFTASVVLLTRCPRALLLPVGPCGSGKTSFSTELARRLPVGTCRLVHRDRVFGEERSREGATLAKAKERTHARLMEALEKSQGESVLVIDSTNGSPEARQLYAQKYRPDCLIAVNFNTPPAEPSSSDSVPGAEDRLLAATMERTEAEVERGEHPSFPVGEEEQREKHRRVLLGLTFASEEELAEAARAAGRGAEDGDCGEASAQRGEDGGSSAGVGGEGGSREGGGGRERRGAPTVLLAEIEEGGSAERAKAVDSALWDVFCTVFCEKEVAMQARGQLGQGSSEAQ